MPISKENISKALETLRKESKKRNFSQTVDLIVTLKSLDLKKTENQVDFFTALHYPTGKKVTVCAFVGPELKDEAGKNMDKAVLVDDFPAYSDPKKAKSLVNEYDYFVAQANIMPKVAQVFGKVLGPKGKMPNPKAGCVVPPKAMLKPLHDKLQKTVRLKAKTALMIQTIVGSEAMKDEEIIDNIITLYNQIMHHLPGEENNIKGLLIKFTMSKPIKVM